MDNLQHQWPQVSAENNKSAMDNNNSKKLLAKPPPSAKDGVVNCPRCDSTNTKFCYYNNYSLTQPRYFCKGCRRYWTQGGTLRNVPVGGGSRKNRRPLPSPPSIQKVNTTNGGGSLFTDTPPPFIANNFNFLDSQNPSNAHRHDLNLGFLPSSSSQSNHYHDVISKGMTLIESSGNPNNFQFSGGFSNFLDFKPPSSNNSLNFSLDNSAFGSSQGFGSFQLGLQGGSGGGGGARVLFPVDDLKPVAAVEQNNDRVVQNGDSGGGYWSSTMLGGRSW